MENVYIIDCPAYPLEPAGSTNRGGGVWRTVTYVGSTKVVTWDYTDCKWN